MVVFSGQLVRMEKKVMQINKKQMSLPVAFPMLNGFENSEKYANLIASKSAWKISDKLSAHCVRKRCDDDDDDATWLTALPLELNENSLDSVYFRIEISFLFFILALIPVSLNWPEVVELSVVTSSSAVVVFALNVLLIVDGWILSTHLTSSLR